MKLSILTLLFAITGVIARAQGNHKINPTAFDSVETRINKALQDKSVPSIVIVVAKNGKIIYQRAFGYADIRKKIRATLHTPYQLASATKPFTATAIMILHQRGLINIDSPVTKYVPELRLNKADTSFATPTVRQVLNHTSGLGTYFDIGYSDEHYSFDNFHEGWKRYGTIFFNPGTVSEYSNLGYGLLSRVIANVSGKSYPEFMQKELFAPLELHDTYVDDQKIKASTPAPKYNANGTELPKVINNTAGAGNIYASVRDLAAFGMFHLQGRNKNNGILKPELVRLMSDFKSDSALYTINKNTFYGLGWYHQEDAESPVIWHEGGMPGASSMLKIYPKEGVVIAVITNTYNPPFVRDVTDDLTQIVLPKHQVIPINEMASYKYYTSDTSLYGSWSGYISVNSMQIPANLTIGKSEIILDYTDMTLKSFLTDDQPLPHKSILLYAVVDGKYFLGTTTGILPASHLRRELSHLLILKLLRKNNLLTGFATIMAAGKREYYAYPFFVSLKKRE